MHRFPVSTAKKVNFCNILKSYAFEKITKLLILDNECSCQFKQKNVQ